MLLCISTVAWLTNQSFCALPTWPDLVVLMWFTTWPDLLSICYRWPGPLQWWVCCCLHQIHTSSVSLCPKSSGGFQRQAPPFHFGSCVGERKLRKCYPQYGKEIIDIIKNIQVNPFVCAVLSITLNNVPLLYGSMITFFFHDEIVGLGDI